MQQIDNLVRLKTSPANAGGSLLSDEEYARQRADLLQEKARIEELLQDVGHRVEQWLKLSEGAFEFACHARNWFAVGTPDIKKRILLSIGSNLILKAKKLDIQAKKPFFILEQSPLLEIQETTPIEPEKTTVLPMQKSLITTWSPRRLAGLDDARTSPMLSEDLAASVYRFFRNVSGSPAFKLSDWDFLLHAGSMDGSRN